MIKRIDTIKDFGIFKNFNWNSISGIKEFEEKNIIYGWNYSGKTTLSRIFSSLRDNTTHADYKKSFFKLTCDNGIFDSTTLDKFPNKVLVFNAEYSKENLRWEFDSDINAIYFEVGDNAKISEQIEKLSNVVTAINGNATIKGKKEKYQRSVVEYEAFENLFTQEAGRIKNDVFSSLIEFNKGHLKKIKDKILNDIESVVVQSKGEISILAKTVKI